MRASLAAVLFALSAVASAQTLLWEHASPNGAVTPDISYGYFLLMPGDLNFDGVSDVLVSNSASPNGAQANAGYVGILSGVDGSPIYELHGVGGGLFWNPALNCFGLAPGDIDGDGARDFWIRYAAAPFTNPVEQLVSGATGTVIPNPPPWANPWYFPVGDLNGDFIDDLVSVNYYLTAYAGPAYTQQLWSTPLRWRIHRAASARTASGRWSRWAT